MKPSLSAVLALLVLALSGCFSAMSKQAGAWSGDTSVPPGAVALDVVTAPIQAPFWIIAGVGYAANGDKPEARARFQKSFIEDSNYRQQFIRSKSLKPHNLDFLMSKDMTNTLSDEDVRYLWSRFKNTATGMRHELLIAPRNTPSDILVEYYRGVMAQAEKREGSPQPHELVYHERLLLHPNLPKDIINEIISYDDRSVNEILQRRKGA